MKTSAPTRGVLIVSIVLVVLGLLGSYGVIPQLGAYAFWLVVIGYVVLLLGNLLTGL